MSYLDLLTGEKQQLVNAQQSLGQVFTFSIGGGSFHEYESFKIVIDQVDHEVADRDKNLASTQVIYGCDHVFRPTEFLDLILSLQ